MDVYLFNNSNYDSIRLYCSPRARVDVARRYLTDTSTTPPLRLDLLIARGKLSSSTRLTGPLRAVAHRRRRLRPATSNRDRATFSDVIITILEQKLSVKVDNIVKYYNGITNREVIISEKTCKT